mmetsp:Transcript_25023/g.38697  ORF Transcript_25023/g.38697 Transcript_25023/m.38697 type:complete len:690 (+) Transcript_25023:121-2190(+)
MMMNGSNNNTAVRSDAKDEDIRAVHRIRLSAIRHNFGVVEQAAASQKCSVITVVKADAYGHGARLTARHLVDRCGASAFAVATLEEAIWIRKEFPLPQHANIRIMVLGPPVNVPRCFDQYLHHGIEVMVSGMEVAEALWQWSRDVEGIKLSMVESAASESKEQALADVQGVSEAVAMRSVMLQNNGINVHSSNDPIKSMGEHEIDKGDISDKAGIVRKVSDAADAAAGDVITAVADAELLKNVGQQPVQQQMNMNVIVNKPPTVACSATLSHTSGQHLANEVRNILLQQKTYMYQKQASVAANAMAAAETDTESLSSIPRAISPSVSSHAGSSLDGSVLAVSSIDAAPVVKAMPTVGVSCFKGIEDVARGSRISQKREERKVLTNGGPDSSAATACFTQKGVQHRRKLRWHALVDSGMGRLGFKTDFAVDASVDLVRKLYLMEVERDAPIEFFGMVTHMADANEGSKFTRTQMKKFVCLLEQVRKADVPVPTCSTDNSSALLTTNLKHFDPEFLKQDQADTRGFVRCGGAIYGQRPAFKQLRAVSTLAARVRHVATVKPGDSVGYDRAYVAHSETRIATISIGFADGYPRELGNGVGRVSIRGATFAVAGNVCMDMLMVDLGNVDDEDNDIGSKVQVNDEAVLWGPDTDDPENAGLVRLQDLASKLKTTQSALTCGLDLMRVKRILVEN